MLEKADNIRFYIVTLVVCGLIIAGSFALTPLRQQWAALPLASSASHGDIETGSIASDSRAEGAYAWNYPRIPWRDYEEGVTEMALTGQPALMVLTSEQCGPCPLYQELFHASAIQAFARSYVFILVDVEARPDLQDRYNIDGAYVPRTFVLNQHSDLAVQQTGSDPHRRFFVDPEDPMELRYLMAQH